MRAFAGKVEGESQARLGDEILALGWRHAQPFLAGGGASYTEDVRALGSFSAALEAMVCVIQRRDPMFTTLIVRVLAAEIGELVGAQDEGSLAEARLLALLAQSMNEALAAYRADMQPMGHA